MISKPNTRSIAACFRSDATSASPPLSRSVAAMLCSTSTRYAPVPQQGSSTMTLGSASPSARSNSSRKTRSTRATWYLTISGGVYQTPNALRSSGS